jgi:hypothetical protein
LVTANAASPLHKIRHSKDALKPALAGIKPKSLPSALLTNRFVNPVVKVRGIFC